MTAQEYREALKGLGLSQVGAARMFGVNERISRRWASGELRVPRYVEHGLRQEWALMMYRRMENGPVAFTRPLPDYAAPEAPPSRNGGRAFPGA